MTDEVIELNLGIWPSASISGGVLVQTDYSTFLTFNALAQNSDGKYQDVGHALVEFMYCQCTKFGYPNDEARPGHPLYNKGLSNYGYGIFEVLNSSWIDQLVEQNRVHFPKTVRNPAHRHFIFTFHDSTFECIAEDLKLEILNLPYEQIFARISQRVIKE